MGKGAVGQGESWTVRLLESEAVGQWVTGYSSWTVGQKGSGTVRQWEMGQLDPSDNRAVGQQGSRKE